MQGTRSVSLYIKTFTRLSFKDLFIRKAIDFFCQLYVILFCISKIDEKYKDWISIMTD